MHQRYNFTALVDTTAAFNAALQLMFLGPKQSCPVDVYVTDWMVYNFWLDVWLLLMNTV